MADRLTPDVRRLFFTENTVVEYAVAEEDSVNGVDPTIPDPALPKLSRTMYLADGVTAVGVLETDATGLHEDNKYQPLPPIYVQLVGLYAQFFLDRWTNPDEYDLPNPSIPYEGGKARVQFRILHVNGGSGPGTGSGGSTSSAQDYIKISNSLRPFGSTSVLDSRLLIQDNVPHELFHRIQYLFNPFMKGNLGADQLAIYGFVREGGAIFATGNVNSQLRRYVIQCYWLLLKPHEYSLAVYDLSRDYGSALMWKYIAEQHRDTGGGDSTAVSEFHPYRLFLEKSPGPNNYQMKGVREALQATPRAPSFDKFRYLLDSGELYSHETTWGNYLIANYLHGRGQPVADARFDYLEDDDPVNWYIGSGSMLSDTKNDMGLESEYGVLTRNDVYIGEDQPYFQSPSEDLQPWSAWYYRIRPKLSSPPRMVRIEYVAAQGLTKTLVQILELRANAVVRDLYRFELLEFEKTINMNGLEEVVVVVAGRDYGGQFTVVVNEIASASDVMVTRWNSEAGKEHEIDPRGWAWTGVSPDIVVTDALGNVDGRADYDENNQLRVRLRNKGNQEAIDIQIDLAYQAQAATPHSAGSAWLPITDAAGNPQGGALGESLMPGDEKWFTFDFAPQSGGRMIVLWMVAAVRVEVSVAGDPNGDNKLALTRFFLAPNVGAAVEHPIPYHHRLAELVAISRGLFNVEIPKPPLPLSPPIVGPDDVAGGPDLIVHSAPQSALGGRTENTLRPRAGHHYPAGIRSVAPGVDRSRLVTIMSPGLGDEATYGLRQRLTPLQRLVRLGNRHLYRMRRRPGLLGGGVRWTRGQPMKTFTWQVVTALGIVVFGVVTMYIFIEDDPTRLRLLAFFDSLVPFVTGAVTGGAVAGAGGFLRGRGLM